MSYSNFQKATELAKKCQYYKTAGQQTEELISKVENVYGFKISSQHYEYYIKYGYIMFFGTEFFGIYKDVFDGIYASNAVIATLDREQFNLPKEWIPLFDYDDGYIAYLDYAHLNSDNEPRVILAIYTGKEYEVTDVIADDLGDFLLELVQEQLEAQNN
ncbi:MAG: SMI1/KNR4 family protein [Hungatella sp.]|jgi:hypothetical protein|nr:SMI1/KNR4 family protein [Hungatella sp.]